MTTNPKMPRHVALRNTPNTFEKSTGMAFYDAVSNLNRGWTNQTEYTRKQQADKLAEALKYLLDQRSIVAGMSEERYQEYCAALAEYEDKS